MWARSSSPIASRTCAALRLSVCRAIRRADARAREDASCFHREARVNLALLQIARRQERAGADDRQRAARTQEREQQRSHANSLGKVSFSPSKTNCTAIAPMISPMTRFITLSPVTPKSREICDAARSIA